MHARGWKILIHILDRCLSDAYRRGLMCWQRFRLCEAQAGVTDVGTASHASSLARCDGHEQLWYKRVAYVAS